MQNVCVCWAEAVSVMVKNLKWRLSIQAACAFVLTGVRIFENCCAGTTIYVHDICILQPVMHESPRVVKGDKTLRSWEIRMDNYF